MLATTFALTLAAYCVPTKISDPSFKLLVAASSANWERKSVFAVTRQMLSSGHISQEDLKMLFQLRDGCPLVKTAAGENATLKPLTPEARMIFDPLVVAENALLETLLGYWDGGTDGLRRLAFLTQAVPSGERLAQRVVMQGLRSLWSNSNPGNGYAPFREGVKIRYNLILAERDPETKAIERKTLVNALEMFDKYVRDAVPNQLYDYVKLDGG